MIEWILPIVLIILGWVFNYASYQMVFKNYSNSTIKIGYGVLSIVPYFTGFAIAFISVGIFIFELILAFGNAFLEAIKNRRDKRNESKRIN